MRPNAEFWIIYGGKGDRLTSVEAERLANACYRIHDHTASEPQPALFWVRVEKDFRA